MPKVSVIIPNYNYGAFLGQRIRSVINQTFQDFEIIYIDDGSTDNSNEVLAKFTHDERIRVFYNSSNSGNPFIQWNKGVRNARGDYIWIAEADDYADKQLLSELVKRLDKHPSAGIAYCQSWKINEKGEILSSWEEWTEILDSERWKKDFVNMGKDECMRYLIFRNTIPNASAVLIRRSLFEQVGGADERMRLNGDWLLWVKILLRSDIAYVADKLNYFRTHEGTVRNKYSDGTNIEEASHVISYISQNVRVPNDILEQAFDKFSRHWVKYLFSYHNRAVLRRSLTIYQIMKKVDRKTGRRLTRNIARYLKKETIKLLAAQ